MSDAIQMNTASQQSLGEILRHARQEQGLELSDVAQVTHVRKEYLKALDEGRYGDLPEDVYSKNFLRLYAQAISLDEKPLLQLYTTERHGQKVKTPVISPKVPEETEAASAAVKPQTQRRQNSFGGLLSTLLLVLLLVLAAVWGFNRFFSPAGTAANDNGTIIDSQDSGQDTGTELSNTKPPLSPESAPNTTTTTSDPQNSDTAPEGVDGATDSPEVTPEVEAIITPDGVVDVSDGPILPNAIPTGEIVSLTVLSNPAGAQVYLDNFPFADITPIELAPVTAGENRILRVELDGYESYEGPLDLSFDRNIEVSLNPVSDDGSSLDEETLASQEGQIRLAVEAASWLEVYQGTARSGGPTLLYRTVEAGESFSFDLPVYLHVGNGAGIRYSIDGQDRGPIGSSGQVVSQAYVE